MDEFQSQDELKPDTSDRPTGRNRKGSTPVRLPLSRQHIMTGIGILILLLLILGIASVLNGSNKQTSSVAHNDNAEKPLALANGSADNSSQPSVAQNTAAADTPVFSGDSHISESASVSGGSAALINQPHAITPPDVVTADAAVPTTDPVPAAGLPVAPATLTSTSKDKQADPALNNSSKQRVNQQTPKVPTAAVQSAEKNGNIKANHQTKAHRTHADESTKSAASAHNNQAVTSSSVDNNHSQNSSSRGYTLQLSAATQKQSLERWARKNNLTDVKIHQTQRNGSSWYILVSGNYPSLSAAKQAINHLPAAARDKAPWVRSLSQIEKEIRH